MNDLVWSNGLGAAVVVMICILIAVVCVGSWRNRKHPSDD